MRTPSLLAQCLPGLVPTDKGSQSLTSFSERDLHLPTPAVEILPSKVLHLSTKQIPTLILFHWKESTF